MTGIIYCLRKKRNTGECHVFEGTRYDDDSCGYRPTSLCGKMKFNESGTSFPFLEQSQALKNKGKYCPNCLLQLSSVSPQKTDSCYI